MIQAEGIFSGASGSSDHVPVLGKDFTYTGSCEVIDDSNEVSGVQWRIKFLTSGTFTPLKNMLVDTFLVGGGASGSKSGGGGGYTQTVKSINLTAKNPYEIIIGAGGVGRKTSSSTSDGNDGGTTSAFNYNAEGGNGGIYSTQPSSGVTGSCGGSGGGSALGGNGGSDGSAGAYWGNSTAGKGQGTTTREFGESTGDLYSGGGGGSKSGREYGFGGAGGGATAQQSAADNTGGGGGGNWNGQPGSGGSGIVIIRKHKET